MKKLFKIQLLGLLPVILVGIYYLFNKTLNSTYYTVLLIAASGILISATFAYNSLKKDYTNNKNSMKKSTYIFGLILNFFTPICIYVCIFFILFRNVQFHLSNIIFFIVGLIITISGMFLPRIEPNNTIGVKFKWALEDNNNWYATQKFSSYVFIIFGSIMVSSPLHNITFLMISSIFAVIILPCLYSYNYYKNSINKNYKFKK